MLPLHFVRLLPRFMVLAHADRVRIRLHLLEEEVGKVTQLLEGAEEGHEHTEGFRAHLQRKLDEWNGERFELIQRLSDVECWLYPSE